tara:strand:+ start:5604 stop:5963 length:360 start_codon:yes stop_codon:yes gene_type:complete
MFLAPQIDVEHARREGPGAIVRTMAETLIDRWSATGAATRDDLVFAGFTQAEIDEHGQTACDRAAKLGADFDPGDLSTVGDLLADEADASRRAVAQMDDMIARLSARTAGGPIVGRISG